EQDPNGLIAKRRVDGFGRVVEEHRPDGVVTTQSFWRAKDGTHIARSTPGHGESEVVLDGKGRAVRERGKGPDVPTAGISTFGVGVWLEKERVFDVKGRLTFESNLHVAGDKVAEAIGAHYAFDDVNRIKEITSPWGAKTSYTYTKDWINVVEPG